MKTLFKNGTVVNVFTGELIKTNVLIEDDRIIGVDNYLDNEADEVKDIKGCFVCPGFIDGHIHIESTMLVPHQLAKIAVPHGTTTIIADPHEIANVCGSKGIEYMIEASRNIPLNVYFMLPSCVPATDIDESGAVLESEELEKLYGSERVLGLAEMMNFPGVINRDERVLKKLRAARNKNVIIDGHAPLVSGKSLDSYISRGIYSDHEVTSVSEATEKIRKGQWLMIRQGSSAKNMDSLLAFFNPPYSHRCMLVTDDRNPADIRKEGQIDNIIRRAVSKGISPVTAITMATLNAATYFRLHDKGAIAPGYAADFLILDNLEKVQIKDVWIGGKAVCENGSMNESGIPQVRAELEAAVRNSMNIGEPEAKDFLIENKGNICRVINIIPGQLITDELIAELDFSSGNGIDIENDILKLAVLERHKGTGHMGIGFVKGLGLKKGAIASSVSHDSHNIITAGTNESDMAAACRRLKENGGGLVAVADGETVAELPLNIAGIMSDRSPAEVIEKHEKLKNAVHSVLGASGEIEPFMMLSFLALPVIPSLKMTTRGLVDVLNQKLYTTCFCTEDLLDNSIIRFK